MMDWNEAQPRRCVVLGLGNLLFGDEGFGIHAVQALQAATLQSQPSLDLEWIDGGVLGLNLLPLVEECHSLLVLDAIDGGLPPGQVIDMEKDAIPLYAGIKLSEHQVGFQEILALACLRGTLPEQLHLVGIQPSSFHLGVELSNVAQEAMQEVCDRAGQVLAGWGLISKSS